MGRTHEALERAEQEYIAGQQRSGTQRPTAASMLNTGPGPYIQNNYREIWTKITTHSSRQRLQTILVTGTSGKCGTTTTAVGLVSAISSDNDNKVLLIDINPYSNGLAGFFALDDIPIKKSATNQVANTITPYKSITNPNLHLLSSSSLLSQLLPQTIHLYKLLESDRFTEVLASAKQLYDYIVFDSPPVITHDEAKVLSHKCDGVLLVLHAGKTRQHVALRAQKELHAGGANMLGVILNRRKHYIPEWLYRRL